MKQIFKQLFILIFYIGPQLLIGNNIDSLENLLPTLPNDSSKLMLLKKLSKSHLYRAPGQALPYLKQLDSLAIQLKAIGFRAPAYHGFGHYHQQKGDFKQARQLLFKALEFLDPKDFETELSIYYSLGMAYTSSSQYDSASYYQFKRLDVMDRVGIEQPKFRVYLTLANIFEDQGEYGKAFDYSEKAWELVKDSKLRKDKGYVLYVITRIYFFGENYERYHEFFQKWLAFQKERNVANGSTAVEAHHAAWNILLPEASPEAIKNMEAAIAAKKGQRNAGFLAENYMILAEMYDKNDQKEKAIQALLDAEAYLLQGNEFKKIRQSIHSRVYTISKEINNYPLALEYLEKKSELADSLWKEEQDIKISELEIQYETAKKEELLAQQRLEIQQKTQERNYLILVISSLLILTGVIFFFQTRRQQTNKKLVAQKEALQNQRIKELEQEKQLAAFNAMLEGQESERFRIAQDLHDGLGGLLTSVKAHVNSITGLEKANSKVFSKTNDILDTACEEVRRISHNMIPRSLSIAGLQGALEDLVADLNNRGLQCDLEIISLPISWPNTKSATLYRIFQELTTNISKHAEAKKILIQILEHDNNLNILVEDDGRGFAPEQVDSGIGLSNVDSRIRYLKGKWEIDSVIGEGTTINIEIPV